MKIKIFMMYSIILNHQKDLLAYSFFLTKSKGDAEDLLQDTYIRVFSKGENIVQIKNIKSYLMAIMHNIYIDGIRKQKLRYRYTNDLSKTNGEPFYNNIESKMYSQDIHNIIKLIREEWREPLLMYYSGFGYIEMSDRTGLKIETLRMRIYYAKKELKSRLEKV
jgi:RNA polymerase sigma-70 factor, ECF subfamily